MIKKALVTIGILSTLFMVGCANQDTINVKYSNENRFSDTGDSYYIGDDKYYVVVDKKTNITYLDNRRSQGVALSPFIGKDKLPMTLEEYKETLK